MSNEGKTRKYSRRDFLKAAAAGAGGMLLAGCAPQVVKETVVVEKSVEKVVTATPAPTGPVKVLWWRSQGGATGDLLDKFASDFTAADNGIEVQPEYQGGYVDHMNKLIASAAANALPDMILVGDGQYTPLALNGVLLPLDELIEGPNGVDLKKYSAPVYRGVQNGRMYQICYGVSTPIYYYNEEALNAAGLDGPPETWDDFFSDYCPKLYSEDMVAFCYATGNWWQQSPVWSYGVMVDDIESFEIDLANDACVEYFGRMQKSRQDGPVYVPTSAEGGTKAVFGSGLAAMNIQSTGLIGSIDEVSEGKFTAKCGFLPGGPGGRWVPSGGNGLSIIRGVSGEVRDGAWEFIKYMHGPEQWGAYDKLTGYIPVHEDVATAIADVIEADPRRQVAIDQFEFSRWHMRVHYTNARTCQEMKDAWNECVQTDVNVKERLQQLQDLCCQIIQEEGFEPACA